MRHVTGCERRGSPLAALDPLARREALEAHDARDAARAAVRFDGVDLRIRADCLRPGDEVVLRDERWWVLDMREEAGESVRLVIVPEKFEPVVAGIELVRVLAMTRIGNERSLTVLGLDEALGQSRN
jgi:hypothetical protein